ncbi:MAG TPA: phosphatase PAP2 family protein [Candidatus Dormibacteraeota bacterium]|nr:phosphatase PAP2 family protein [Candidatus Dormibacteraeota bacterium]
MSALSPRFFGIAVLGAIFIALTIAITAGVFTSLDRQVASAMHDAWQPSLHGLFQAIAELGGLELTTILLAGLAFYLWQEGFGTDALAVLVFVAAEGFEVFYRHSFYHPGPPRSISQADGPSITELFGRSIGGNSFPSGHMLRTVIVYGLIAFVIRRLSPSARMSAAAVIGAVAIIVLMAFDRLYLDVHWESDVVGGLLLGAIALLAGTVWLDRPRRPRRPQN